MSPPITSGSLTNLDAWKAIGGFDEKLFIDLVDTEYDIRALMKGYCSYRINTVVLTHEIGHIEPSGLPFPRIQQGKLLFGGVIGAGIRFSALTIKFVISFMCEKIRLLPEKDAHPASITSIRYCAYPCIRPKSNSACAGDSESYQRFTYSV